MINLYNVLLTMHLYCCSNCSPKKDNMIFVGLANGTLAFFPKSDIISVSMFIRDFSLKENKVFNCYYFVYFVCMFTSWHKLKLCSKVSFSDGLLTGLCQFLPLGAFHIFVILFRTTWLICFRPVQSFLAGREFFSK